MKRLTAFILALAMVFVLGVVAVADGTASSINPQQRGHVAYLESKYGTRRAQDIIEGYKKSTTTSQTVIQKEIRESDEERANAVYEIPQPGTGNADLSRLRVGDYFWMSGRYYYVGRFTTINGARVLVAFPADGHGNIDVLQPRYFYV